MVSFEHIVNSSTLDIIVPNVVLDFPAQDMDHSAWLRKLRSQEIERERAFFDESLDFFFVLGMEQHDAPSADPARPPLELLSFLVHTQVSYEATYISPASRPAPSALRLGTPPRTTSLKPSAETGGLHVPPSIFPLNTPNPTPVTTEQDRRYVRSEGATLASGMWGEELDPATKPRNVEYRDAFALLWDETADVWVAVYRMCINVAFLPLAVRDPLLCLTASITVRERPLPMTPARATLATMFQNAGSHPEPSPAKHIESFNHAYEIDKFYHGLDEVNLLEGLNSAPTFGNASLALSSTRIGAKIRKWDFTLPYDPPPVADSSATMPPLSTRATLRKSFRRTLCAVSGFRMRMRTVFVPYLLFQPSEPDAEVDHVLAAGHTEHTVVLCVELEHPGEAPEAFLVDAVDVKIGVGDGTRVRVLPWCDRPPQEIFPLRLSMHEQCNLLFAVELLSAPIDKEGFPSAQAATGELQRPVTITVRGQPISDVSLNGDQSGAKVGKTEFQTRLFSSHWNCVLDLASPGSRVASQGESEALPEPPSPFPAATPRLAIPPTGQQGQQSPVLSPPSPHVLRSPRLSLSFRTSRTLVPSGSAPGSSPLSKHAYTPPSLTAAISSAPRTTYAPPASPGIPPPAPLSRMLPMAETDEAFVGSGGTTPPPITPAYPAFSKGSTVLATSRAQGPLALWGSARASTAIELPRSGMLSLSSPVPSPLALLPSSSMVPQRERIVVSVGLQNDAGTGTGTGTRKLVPYDEFVLDIFIYNQSAWTRRFELTVQERRRKRHEKYSAGQGQRQQRYHDGAAVRGGAGASSGSGIVPLENRVRVGPLRPATCQSVRIAFLALTPGVHTIDALTLTDTETRHALTLRTSMDIVVHETRPLNRPLPRC